MERTMTAANEAPGIAVPLGQVFRSEIDRAKRLGYEMQTHVSGIAVVVRLVPKTQKAKRVAAKHAPQGSPAPAIETVVPYDSPGHRIDALHAGITAVLELAHDAG
jgi:hypothetical protein